MRAKIRANRAAYDEILCLYGDCGTGGELDRVLKEEGVRRIEGAHCYAFYAGEEAFSRRWPRKSRARSTSPIFSSAISTRSSSGGSASTVSRNCATIISAITGASSIWRSSTIPMPPRRPRRQPNRLGLAYERRFTGLGGLRAFLDGATVESDTREEEAPWPA